MDGLVNFSADPKARVQFLRSRGLQEDRKTVLFAPTFNSFKDGRMFPNVFGDEIQAFEDLCRTAKQLGCNLIVKLHPFMVSQIGDPRVHEIAARYRTYFVNKKVLYHVESDSEDYLKYSDVLVSDTSGIITDFMALDRPIIFIEPDNETFNWNETDLSSDLRPGAVAHTKDQLFEGIADALMNPDARSAERKKIRSLIFDYLDGSASRRACDAVLSFYTSSSTRR
jgi:CDP-glycerol glycerophosphotransferase (TagB/SpsB family)